MTKWVFSRSVAYLIRNELPRVERWDLLAYTNPASIIGSICRALWKPSAGGASSSGCGRGRSRAGEAANKAYCVFHAIDGWASLLSWATIRAACAKPTAPALATFSKAKVAVFFFADSDNAAVRRHLRRHCPRCLYFTEPWGRFEIRLTLHASRGTIISHKGALSYSFA